MSSLTASKKVLRALSLSLGGFQVLLLWKGVSGSLAVRLLLFSSKKYSAYLLISGYNTTCNIKITYQCKIIIVPEEGWFGQPKYSTPKKRSFYVVSTSAFIFVRPIADDFQRPWFLLAYFTERALLAE